MANIYDMVDVWNASGTTFTAIKMNVTDTASAAGSLLMDLQVGGVSQFSVNKLGTVVAAQGRIRASLGNSANYALSIGSAGFIGFTDTSGGDTGSFFGGSIDTRLFRDAANTLAQRNGTNAQAFNLYNTFTDASNYIRASFTQTATGLVLDSQFAGTGTEPDNIFELKSGGVSKFKVTKTNILLPTAVNSTTTSIGSITSATSGFYTTDGFDWGYTRVGAAVWQSGFNYFRMGNNVAFGWVAATIGSAADLILARDAAGTLAQRNGVNAQAFNLYNTFTDASNYERGVLKWDSNILKIGTEKLGTGSARALEFQTDGVTRVTIGTGLSTALTVAGSVNLSSGSQFFGWSSLTRVWADSVNGDLRISNNAGNDFGLLKFGGTTDAFPALKRSTTSLQARLADDSAFTNIQGKLTTETAYTAGAPTATGYIVLYDSTGTAYKVPAEAL